MIPEAFYFGQIFPENIIPNLSVLRRDFILTDMYIYIPLNQWSKRCRSALKRIEQHWLIGAQCINLTLAVEESKIKDNKAGQGLFATQPIGK